MNLSTCWLISSFLLSRVRVMNVFVFETLNNCFCSGLNLRNSSCFKELWLVSQTPASL